MLKKDNDEALFQRADLGKPRQETSIILTKNELDGSLTLKNSSHEFNETRETTELWRNRSCLSD